MTRLRLALLTICLGVLASLSAPVHAQSYVYQFGNNPWSVPVSVPGGYVDAANGNLHIEIPIASMPERGAMPFVAKLVYDSHIWTDSIVLGSQSWKPTNVTGQPAWSGWRLVTSAGTGGGLTYTTQNMICYQLVGHGVRLPWNYTTYGNFTFTTPDGHNVPFSGGTVNNEGAPCISSHATYSGFSTDASGYHIDITNYTGAVVHAPDGTQVSPNVEDTNGNYFSVPNSSGDVTDSVGRTPITTTVSGNTITYTVTNSPNTNYTVTVTTETIPVYTAFGQAGVTEYISTPPSTNYLTVVQTIQLPSGTYSFDYDSGTTAAHYGTLKDMTLPTGGVATFGFNVFADAYANENLWLSSSTASGIGTTTYTPSVVSACTNAYCVQNFTVNQPDGSSQAYSFTFDNGSLINGSPWNVSQVFYDSTANGNGLLATLTTDYDFSNAPSVTPIRHTSILPIPGGGSISKKSEYTYDTTLLGNVLTQNDWNYYSGGPPTTQYRATKYTYLSNSDNDMVNKKASINIYPGAGTTAASSTTVNYDGTTTSSLTGATNHDDTNFSTSYNARGNVTSVVANSLTTTMTYDMTGQVTSVKDSNNNSTTLGYVDSFFNDSATGPTPHSGAASTNAYLTTITNAMGWITNLGYYWGSGKLAQMVDYNTATTTFDYMDVIDRPTQTHASMGWGITQYTSANQVDTYLGIATSTPGTSCSSCRHDQAALDSLGRVSTQSLVNDPEGEDTVTTSYDTMSGRTVSVTNPKRTASNPTDGSDAYTYDGLGRILTVTHSAGGVVHTYYGANVTSAAGGNTAQLCSATTYGYGYPTLVVDEAGMKRESWTDGLGRTIEVDEPNSAGTLAVGTCYTYDVLNNLLAVVQGSQTRAYTYDAASRPLTATTPESGLVTSYYTTSGGAKCSGNPSSVCRRTDARGITTTYAYDNLNRLTGITYTGTTPAATYTYDAGTNQKGFRTGMTDGSGSTTWTYNLVGWVLTENRTIAGQAKTISYTYNQDGSLATIVYPSGRTVTYTTSNAQRATSAIDNTGIQYALTASYAPIGALNGVIYGKVNSGFAGITTAAAYNPRFEPTTISATSTAGTAQSLSYSFSLPGGNNGSVSAVTNSANTALSESFTYDPLNRINSAATSSGTATGCWGQTFGTSGGLSDDQWSNLTAINSTQCSTGTLSVTASSVTNRLSATGFGFDSSGNMTGDSLYTYTFDAEDHLTQASGMSGGPWNYVYDGNGMRIEKSNASGGTLYFRSLSGAAIAETDLSGNITSEYVFFAGQRIARRDSSNNVYFYYTDQVGSTTAITTGTGALCYQASFTPYGEEHLAQATTCPQNYKFTGYERDSETGLDYAFARYYNSRLGRFMSADPLGGNIGNPQSLNRYAYVFNNSTNLTDPFGLKCYVGEGCSDLGFGAWAGSGWGFGIVDTDSNVNSGYAVTQTWTLTVTTSIISMLGGSCDDSGCSVTSYGSTVNTTSQSFEVEGDPFFGSGQALQVNGGITTSDFQKGYYKLLGKRLNKCIGTVFGRTLTQTMANAPNLDVSKTTADLNAVGENQPFNGPHGTVLVANEVWNKNINTSAMVIAEVYTHELGNILDERLNPNVPAAQFGRTYGNPRDTDTDTGRALSRCLFPNFKF